MEFQEKDTVLMKSKGLSFTFDEVFNISASQAYVYESVGLPLIDDIIKGYNCTIFAYGQTSSGKTYSMMNLPKKSFAVSNSSLYANNT